MALFKRPGSKYYWYKFTFGGGLVQRSSKCTNRSDARKVESAHLTQLALGKIGIKPKKESPIFSEAAEEFLAWKKIEAAEPSTYKRYKAECDCLIRFFGNRRADKITKQDAEKFIEWRKAQISQKTGEPITNDVVNREVLTLKNIFDRLIEADYLEKNIADQLRRLKANDPAFHVITEEEEKAYLLAAEPILMDCFALMIETGMRCAEVYRIRRRDVFTEKNYLQVTKGKTKASVRRVYLTEKAKRILETRLNRFAGENLFPRGDLDNAPQTGSLDHHHAKVMDKLKFKFRLYDARHTFATRAIEKGIDPVTLAAILGHSSLKMLSRYAHPSEARKKDAMKRLQSSVKRKAKAV